MDLARVTEACRQSCVHALPCVKPEMQGHHARCGLHENLVAQTTLSVPCARAVVSVEIGPDDWAALDPWWSAHTQAWPATRRADTVSTLDPARVADCWSELDSWSRAYADSESHVYGAASSRTLFDEQLVDAWTDLDSWWNAYTEIGHEMAVDIRELLRESNEAWRQSPAPFDADPLAAALTHDEGPLLPSTEEGWSDWLAKVLRPSAPLVAELFDVPVDGAPDNILREDQLTKDDGGFRRPDLLLFLDDCGTSIEVKLGDEHYEKTEETARLAEREYDDHEWHHTLLLPERKRDRLSTIVAPAVSSRHDGRLQVEWDDPGPITVVFWRDVTAAIRRLLRRGDAVNDQWAANAYLFCAAVEQQIMNFQPMPVIEQMADPTTVVDTIQPIAVAGVLGEQLTYLGAMQNHDR